MQAPRWRMLQPKLARPERASDALDNPARAPPEQEQADNSANDNPDDLRDVRDTEIAGDTVGHGIDAADNLRHIHCFHPPFQARISKGPHIAATIHKPITAGHGGTQPQQQRPANS